MPPNESFRSFDILFFSCREEPKLKMEIKMKKEDQSKKQEVKVTNKFPKPKPKPKENYRNLKSNVLEKEEPSLIRTKKRKETTNCQSMRQKETPTTFKFDCF
jgi:hypothetical protein